MTERSPLEQAGRIQVPVLILHGALDTTATEDDLSLIQQRLRAGGGECTLRAFDDDTHALRRHRDDIHSDILRFLSRFEPKG